MSSNLTVPTMKKFKIGDEFVGKDSGLKAWVVGVGETDYEIAFERRIKGAIEKRHRVITFDTISTVLRNYSAMKPSSRKRGERTDAS